jgi:AcrR family transcriptional regulator
MRISARAKQQTRKRILDAAERLFRSEGYDRTSTRSLSSAAGIATGTLFNYFPSKEALALAIVTDALDRARGDLEARRREGASLQEALFDHVAAGLRRLAPHRSWVTLVVDGSAGRASPRTKTGSDPSDRVRREHLQTVGALVSARGLSPSAVSLQLYWTLYVGLLAFWSRDASRSQEDTLVLLDESLHLFVRSLAQGNDQPEHHDAPHPPHRRPHHRRAD